MGLNKPKKSGQGGPSYTGRVALRRHDQTAAAPFATWSANSATMASGMTASTIETTRHMTCTLAVMISQGCAAPGRVQGTQQAPRCRTVDQGHNARSSPSCCARSGLERHRDAVHAVPANQASHDLKAAPGGIGTGRAAVQCSAHTSPTRRQQGQRKCCRQHHVSTARQYQHTAGSSEVAHP